MLSRLKALELQGYKTFASRTFFEFPGRITAIVGPNGSGKSNVADSIRWVLGEQSFSLLRGRKTEDMIFAGSENRSRAGMASATIIFDNEDGWLPIDFSEVSIGRRAYRDGQNDYILNGQRIRLKEISELLGQSGLAERTYTIIGQGLVDAALSLKPDERRRFFEEAAGIGLFRSRREESLMRLENTRRNLERAQDILTELEPRLRSLEKQARRVQEYKQIQADLRNLLREWYGYHWHQTQQEISRSRDALRGQQDLLDQSRERLDAIELDIKEQQLRLNAARVQTAQFQDQLSIHQKQLEDVNRNLAITDERQKSFLREQQSLDNEIARLEEEIRSRDERKFELEKEKHKLQDDVMEARLLADKLRKEMQERQESRNEIERKITEIRRSSIAAETRQVLIKARLSECANRIASINKSHFSLTEIISRDDDAANRSQSALHEAIQQRELLESEIDALISSLQELQNNRLAEETKQKYYQVEHNRLNSEVSRAQAQMKVLEQAEKSFSGYNQGAKHVLESSQRGNITGKIRTLTSQIEVPQEYELAISSALGEYLDSILLGDTNSLHQILEILQKSEKGRAVILPETMDASLTESPLPTIPEAIGIASDLVKYPPEYTTIVRMIMGRTVLVTDRKAAMVSQKILPVNSKIVTLQGEVFQANGSIIAGRDGRAGLVGRTRQTRELQNHLGQIEDLLNQLDKEQNRHNHKLDELNSRIKTLEVEIRQLHKKKDQLSQIVRQSQLEMEKIHQRQDWQNTQLRNLDDDNNNIKNEVGRLEAEIGTLESRQTEILLGLELQTKLLDELPMEELINLNAHWETSVAVNTQAITGAAKRLEEMEQLISSQKDQRNNSILKLTQLGQEMLKLQGERNILHRNETLSNYDIDEIQKLLLPLDKKLRSMEEKFNTRQGDHTAALQNLNICERHVTQVQMEYSRHREALDTLRRKIEDDFGLVAFEYSADMSGQTPLPLEGMVEQLPAISKISPDVEEGITRSRTQLRRMGSINLEAQAEYEEVFGRYNSMVTQMDDLKAADLDLRQIITELDELMQKEFRKTFTAVSTEFRKMFTRLFGGGSARLILSDEENITDTGIEIEARLPGRREQGLSLLSGGERSLTAVALIFALLKVSPTPFCVLDEVDAMLDEANVGRFCDLLKELSEDTQFIVITHNRNTVQIANVIYGITMGLDSTSQMVSLRLDEVSPDLAK